MSRFNWLLAIRIGFYCSLVACCIVAFSPSKQFVDPQIGDKWVHFLVFFGFAMMSHIAHPRTNTWLLSGLLVLFGLGIEVGQTFFPYRTFSWLDLLADGAGVACYFLLLGSWLKPGRFLPG